MKTNICLLLIVCCADDLKDLEFDRKKVSLLEQLGDGKLGPVLRGTASGIILPGEATDVFIKMLRNDSRPSDRMLLIEEATARKRLSHRNVVSLLGVCTKSSPNFIIDEYFPVDLKMFLKDAAPQPDSPATVSVAELLWMAQEISDGLCYFDAMRFVHKGLCMSPSLFKIGQ